jgi:hypothetical protein
MDYVRSTVSVLPNRHLPNELFLSLHDVDWHWDRIDLRKESLETECVGAARLGRYGWTIKRITFLSPSWVPFIPHVGILGEIMTV